MTPRTKLRLVKLAFLLLGAGIFAALVHQAGLKAIATQVSSFGWALPLLLIPSLMVYLVDAVGWRLCMEEAPPYLQLFLIRQAGESLNNTLPAAYLGGEPMKALLLKRHGISGMDGLASAIVAKTALTVAQIVFVLLGIGAALLVAGQRSDQIADQLPALLFGAAAVSLFIGGSVFVAYLGQRHGLGKLLQRFSARTGVLQGLVESKQDELERLDAALTGFYQRHGARFWLATGVFLLAWTFEAVEVAIFCHLLGLPLGPLEVFALASLASIVKAAGFFIPASLGAQEGGTVLLFLAVGLTSLTGMTFSIVRRLRELVWIAIGLVILAALGVPTEETEPDQAPAAA